ncbi:hypothetical protein [Sphingomonas crusticola]|uniref:hypothetical protein n=1 Tax=Sphingomonas crusticola TaxID=1697973 RepID=UPI0013C3563A|nr:hypothetical protein [Sphingomonas crusticola]
MKRDHLPMGDPRIVDSRQGGTLGAAIFILMTIAVGLLCLLLLQLDPYGPYMQ